MNPETVRRTRLRKMLKSLEEAKGKWVKRDRFVGTVCYQTGAKEETVRGYLLVLVLAGLIEVEEEKNRVRLAP